MKATGPALALAALTATLVLWGTAFVAIRIALDGFGVAGLTAGRLLVASLALAAVAPLLRLRRPERADLPRIVGCGVVGMSFYLLLLNAGQRTVPAGTAVLLINTAPLFAVLLAWLLLGERLASRGRIGIALGFIGATVMALGESSGLGISGDALLIVAAAVCFALFVLWQKPLLARYSGLELTCYAMWAGTLATLPLLPALASDLRTAAGQPILAVLFLGIGPSAIGYATWAVALARFGVGTTANALYLLPLVAITGGWLLLDETPHPVALVGGAIALAGVAISRGRPRPLASAELGGANRPA